APTTLAHACRRTRTHPGSSPGQAFAGTCARTWGRAELSRREMRQPIRILGIDPGLRRTGWGVIDVDGNRLIHVACGSVASDDKAALAQRLVALHVGLTRVVAEFRPAEAAVEATF